jgi:hypothetical protein
MKTAHFPVSIISLATLAAMAAAAGTVRAEESILRSSNPSHFEHWYGRAGGSVGSERIGEVHAAKLPPASVSVTYDKDVAERTNMARDGVDSPKIGVTYDKDVAERTNMSRGKQEPAASVAESQK